MSRAQCRRSTRRTLIRAGSRPGRCGNIPTSTHICATCFRPRKFQPLGKRGSLDILIAGCGTGQHAILTTQQHEGARMLAIDLSRASLAYAAAKIARAQSRHRIRTGRHHAARRAPAALRPDRIGRRAASSGRPLRGMARAALAVASRRIHADRALQRDRALGRGGRARRRSRKEAMARAPPRSGASAAS